MRYFLSFCVLFIVAGCGSATSPDEIVFPATNVSFRQHVEPLFTVSCNMSGCHDAARTDNNGVDLTSFGGVRAINVAIPFDTACGLIRVVYGVDFQHTAAGITLLNSNHRIGLKQWI